MISITTERALELLTECVAERGEEYVYTSEGDVTNRYPDITPACYYVHQDSDGVKSPGCIAGLALHKAGVPLDVLEEHERMTANSLLRSLRSLGIIDYDDDAAYALRRAQVIQDDGGTWGAALARASEAPSF